MTTVANARPASTPGPDVEHRRPSIAVVDDDSGFAGYLRTFLALRGYEARAYTRGDEIVAAIRQGEPPDIVLLDVAMPGMDRLQTLRALRAAKPELQVIMLSGTEAASGQAARSAMRTVTPIAARQKSKLPGAISRSVPSVQDGT